MVRFTSRVKDNVGLLLGVIAALVIGMAVPLQAEEAMEEAVAEGAEEEAAAEPEAKPKEEMKEEKAKKKDGGGSIPEDKVPAPSTTEKSGDPLHDYVVDFENAYAAARPHFAVAKDAKHDYAACNSASAKVEKTSRSILQVHEDRLRMYGNDYHRKLQLLAVNAHRLRVAVAERNRSKIFTYYNQLKIVRDMLVNTHPWK